MEQSQGIIIIGNTSCQWDAVVSRQIWDISTTSHEFTVVIGNLLQWLERVKWHPCIKTHTTEHEQSRNYRGIFILKVYQTCSTTNWSWVEDAPLFRAKLVKFCKSFPSYTLLELNSGLWPSVENLTTCFLVSKLWNKSSRFLITRLQ